jgi:hypothetical protein
MKHLRLMAAALLVTAFSQGAYAATCKISEYRALAVDSTGVEIQVALEPRIASQTVTYTSSAQSSALNSATRFVRIVCDAKAHFRFSTAGTNATASDPFVAADSPEYFGVQAGQAIIIDFYDGTT